MPIANTDPVLTSGLTASAVAKSTRRLLPFLLLMYMLAFLDRVNVGFAKQALQDTVGISDAAFALGASIFFIAYVLLEIPSNLMMHRVGARIWLCRIMVTWGLMSAATMFVQGSMSFCVIRVILGACEAGLFPGVILYLTYWFPDAKRTSVTSFFYFGAPLAVIVGAPISGTLLNFDGLLGLHGFQWMFLLEGLAASLVGIWAFFYLDNRPETAKFLSPQERAALSKVIDAEQREKIAHGPGTVLSSLGNWTVLYFSLIFFLIQMGVSVISFYLPTQISQLLHTKSSVVIGFVVAVPWLCALVGTYLIPKAAERSGQLCLIGASCLFMAAIGMGISAGAQPAVSLVALCIAVTGIWAAQPMFWTLLTNYLGGAAAVGGVALVNTLANIGNFVSPNIKTFADSLFESNVAGLLLLSGTVFIASVLFLGTHKHQKAVDEDRLMPGRVQ